MRTTIGKIGVLGVGVTLRTMGAQSTSKNYCVMSREIFAWSREHEALAMGFQPSLLEPLKWRMHPCPESGAKMIIQAACKEYERLLAERCLSEKQIGFYVNGDFAFTFEACPAKGDKNDLRGNATSASFEICWRDSYFPTQCITLTGSVRKSFARCIQERRTRVR